MVLQIFVVWLNHEIKCQRTSSQVQEVFLLLKFKTQQSSLKTDLNSKAFINVLVLLLQVVKPGHLMPSNLNETTVTLQIH